MSHEGTPNFSYLVFDLIKYDSTPWLDRNYELCEWFDKHGSKFPFYSKSPFSYVLLGMRSWPVTKPWRGGEMGRDHDSEAGLSLQVWAEY